MIEKDRLQTPRENPPIVGAAAGVAMGPFLVIVLAMVRSQNGVLWSVQRSNAKKEGQVVRLRTKYTMAKFRSFVPRTTEIMVLVSHSHSEWNLFRTAWNQ